MRWSLISAVLLCSTLLGATAKAENPLNDFLDGLETFSAEFEQRLLSVSGELLERAAGQVQLSRPDMFSWSYHEPYQQRIISDGSVLWVYEADLEQVTVSDLPEHAANSPALLLRNSAEISEQYLIGETQSEAGLSGLVLTSKHPESYYRSVRLTFTGGQLSSMALVDTLGQQLLLEFTGNVRNPELESGLFHFEPDENVDVIDTRQGH